MLDKRVFKSPCCTAPLVQDLCLPKSKEHVKVCFRPPMLQAGAHKRVCVRARRLALGQGAISFHCWL